MPRNFLDPHMVYFQFFNTILNRKHPSHYHVIFCRNLKTYANYAVISCILIRQQFSACIAVCKDTFLSSQLCSLSISQQHWGSVGLEPCYCFGFSSLSNHIHCL